MNLWLVLISMLFAGLFLVLGFYLRDKAGLAFTLAASLLMVFLGIGIVGSGIEIELGDITINATTNIIEVEPQTQNFVWLDTTAGIGLLLLGIFLFFYSIISYDKQKGAFGKGGL